MSPGKTKAWSLERGVDVVTQGVKNTPSSPLKQKETDGEKRESKEVRKERRSRLS